jgi:sortase A
MKPDETSNKQQNSGPLPQQWSTPDNKTEAANNKSREAATQIIRHQIDNLYDSDTRSTDQHVSGPQAPSTNLETASPYQKTHAEHVDPQMDKWRQYHSAWQNYYQKYYEGYYTYHLRMAQQTLQDKANANTTIKPQPADTGAHSNDGALFDLRQKLRSKVRESATKVRKSRHFWPIFAGVITLLIFVLLQYNRIIISNVMAYVSPGDINPQNIIVNPTDNVAVSSDPRLIIPKINVDVPVIYDVGNDYNSQMDAMSKGVAQFAIPGASSHPGQIGNTVIAGHSSNALTDSGDYKFIFVQLDKLEVGDTIYANYNSVRYTYTVTSKEVVKPTDVSKLVYPVTKPIMTLITCVPIGTANSRLLVTADQISPDPGKSTAAPTDNTTKSSQSIPGNTQTFFEWLFGNKN